jgi:hypothetical protein
MAERDSGWKDIFTKTIDGLTIVTSKAFINYKAEYTVRFGVVKTDTNGSYFSPNVPAEKVVMATLSELHVSAIDVITKDREKDAQAEAVRIKTLSGKPGQVASRPPAASGGVPSMPRDKNGPRSTGKTAKKKAKLQARADEARAAASK